MKTPALRTVCAALLLSFWITCLLLVASLGISGNGWSEALIYGLPIFAGLAGAGTLRRIIPPLQWREILRALFFVPLLVLLFITSAKVVFGLKSRDMNGMDELSFVYSLWVSMGAFLLPLVDNDLRRKEPNLALRRANIGVIALCFASLVGFGLLQKPSPPDWQWRQSGYAVLLFAGLPSFLITAMGWAAGMMGAERTGAYAAAVGTLAFCAVVLYWRATGGDFPG